ncbi:MAG: DUF1576 domain-containing protein [Erysipelotrichaceae bacterium]|nr:DUF1576 domain-containing protein [Erysipelotrichaceae bacterium]
MKKGDSFIFAHLFVYACPFILFGVFLCPSLTQLKEGLIGIISSDSALAFDAFHFGLGPGFVNAGLCFLLVVTLLKIFDTGAAGKHFASSFIVAGYSFYGENILNILPMICGVFLYSRVKKEPFKNHVVTSMFSTCMAPFVSYIFLKVQGPVFLRLLAAFAVGCLLGFLAADILSYAFSIHKGYNLFNMGFAAGICCTLIATLFRFLGFTYAKNALPVTGGNNLLLGTFFGLIYLSMIIEGFFLNGKSFKGLKELLKQTGKAPVDFFSTASFPVTLINMGGCGLMATAYVFLVGGQINGPVISCIWTISGFAAFGMHMANMPWSILGIVLGSFIFKYDLGSTGILTTTLNSACMAPIAGDFGPIFGMITGLIHVNVAPNISFLHGFLCLYNNGFAAGFVAYIMLMLHTLYKNLFRLKTPAAKE